MTHFDQVGVGRVPFVTHRGGSDKPRNDSPALQHPNSNSSISLSPRQVQTEGTADRCVLLEPLRSEACLLPHTTKPVPDRDIPSVTPPQGRDTAGAVM